MDLPPPERPYPDLSVAFARGPRHFDGNAQYRMRLWYWTFIERLEDEDFSTLLESDALDWAIFPIRGLV